MGRRKWKFDADTRAMAAEYYCEHTGQQSKSEDIRIVMAYPPIKEEESLRRVESSTPLRRRILAAVIILNAKYKGAE